MFTTSGVIALAVGTLAAGCDLWARRIPNVLTFGTALAAVPYLLITGGWAALGWGLLGWLTGAALFFPFFALGGLGAGDVKLLAALGMWLGPGQTVWVALFASMAGGVMALVVAGSRGYLREAFGNLRLLLTHWRVSGVRPLESVSLGGSRGPRLPYALPITAGVLMMLWLR